MLNGLHFTDFEKLTIEEDNVNIFTAKLFTGQKADILHTKIKG